MTGTGGRVALVAAALSAALGLGAATPAPSAPAATRAADLTGYAIATATGAVGTFGGAGFDGDLATDSPRSPVVGIAATADGRGYWVAQRDGAVHPFGDASGTTDGSGRAGALVAIAADPATGGYLTVSSTGAIPHLPRVRVPRGDRVVGIAPSGYRGRGAWVATADGDVLATGSADPVRPPPHGGRVVGIAATPDGGGYWLVTATGRVLAAGDAPPLRPAPRSPSPAVALVPTPNGRGALVIRSDGSLAALGDAVDRGNASSPLHPPLYPRPYQLMPTQAVGGAYLAPGPQPAQQGPWRVAFLGDSLSVVLGRYTRQYVATHHLGGWVANGGILGCGVAGTLDLADYSKPAPPAPTLPACGRWVQQYRRTLALDHPDVVVLLLGFWESQRRRLPDNRGPVVTVRNSPAYRRYLAAQLHQLRRLVATSHARVLVLPAPYYGDGTPRANVVAFNQLLAGTFRADEPVDLTALLDPDGHFAMRIDGVTVRSSDRVHLTRAGVQDVVDPVLVPAITALTAPRPGTRSP